MSRREPDFLHELDSRRHALFNLVTLTVGCVALLIVPLFFFDPNDILWWYVCLIILMVVNCVIFGVTFVPLAIRGGTYRVVIQDGILRVDSPNSMFGRSFEVPLSKISQLVTCRDRNDRVTHEIQTTEGDRHVLDANFSGKRHIPADQLFEAIQRLNPTILAVSSRAP